MPAPGLADASVRAARPADAEAMAAVQLAAWRSAYAHLLADAALAAMDPVEVAAAWRAALEAPPDPRARAHVAVEDAAVVGLTALAPSTDADLDESTAEIGPLLVHPEHQGRGHGSRLLNAAADHARDAGFRLVTMWVVADDGRFRAFLEGAGWAPDGGARTVDAAGAPLREIRLHARIAGP